MPYGSCWCGCGKETNRPSKTDVRVGRIKGEPMRYVHGHHGRPTPKPYVVDGQTGCWVWQWGTRGKGGYRYGHTRRNGKKEAAHRAFYEERHGPIPPGMHLHHRCVEEGYGTPLCVNPDHLEPLTPREHYRRHGFKGY